MKAGREVARVDLGTWPTPLHDAARLRDVLGGEGRCPRILLKRDDLSGLAFGGNKARKLEFIVADALREEATVLVTTGAVQSNHARMTAAAARTSGLGVSLVLRTASEAPTLQGNLLLDRLFGAELHYVLSDPNPLNASTEEDAALEEVIADLRRRGERPYLVALGGSNALGTLGYVAGTAELMSQLEGCGAQATHLYYASGSRGTQAGLALGRLLYGASYLPYGIAVSEDDGTKAAHAKTIANEAAEILGSPTRVAETDLRTDFGYVGEDYGIPTPGCLEAVDLLARHEGILLDPVYTAKAMGALIHHVRRSVLSPADVVVFLHTGGAPALFAQAQIWEHR